MVFYLLFEGEDFFPGMSIFLMKLQHQVQVANSPTGSGVREAHGSPSETRFDENTSSNMSDSSSNGMGTFLVVGCLASSRIARIMQAGS